MSENTDPGGAYACCSHCARRTHSGNPGHVRPCPCPEGSVLRPMAGSSRPLGTTGGETGTSGPDALNGLTNGPEDAKRMNTYLTDRIEQLWAVIDAREITNSKLMDERDAARSQYADARQDAHVAQEQRDAARLMLAESAAEVERMQVKVNLARLQRDYETQRRVDVAVEYQKAGKTWDTARLWLTAERDEARAEINGYGFPSRYMACGQSGHPVRHVPPGAEIVACPECAHPEDTGTAYDDRPRVTP